MASHFASLSDPPAAAPRRKGCLIEALVVAGLVGLGTMLLVPAMNSARTAARRAQFTWNLKQLGLGMHNYHSVNGCLPAAFLPDRSGRPMQSWRMALLPWVEQGNAFNSCNLSLPWDAAENLTIRSTRMNLFLRPEEEGGGPPLTKFLAVVGPRTAFPGATHLAFGDIRDGTATTIAFGEVAESEIRWAEPRDLRFDGMDFRVNGPRKRDGFGSPYGGTRVLMIDGSVKTLLEPTTPALLRALVTANGGEAIEEQDGQWRLAVPSKD
jgi:type II secretory pathway pseudopilin PulG